MITDRFIREMEEIVGKENVSVSRANAELYSYDASLARGKPGVVVFPGDGQEVARVVRAAQRSGVPFVPRGFGTNLSGGTIVTVEGLVICLSRLNRILGMYPESRYAVVQPGVTNLELQDALATLGFFYAPSDCSSNRLVRIERIFSDFQSTDPLDRNAVFPLLSMTRDAGIPII